MKIEIEYNKKEEEKAKGLVKDIKMLNKDFDWGLKLIFELKELEDKTED